jgi:predicted transcriptional regulator|tara:strand:+ start:352 stop:546 length:195 start_codon:yes stop_codon:yes gene_type:complete
MKVRLKEGVSLSDVPRISGVHKRVISAFTNKEKTMELDVMPKGLDEFVEEASPVVKPKPKKEDE